MLASMVPLWDSGRMTGARRRWASWGLAAYLVLAAVVLLSPLSAGAAVDLLVRLVRDGLGLTGFGAGWIEFAANVALFVPLGFLLTALWSRPWVGVLVALAVSAGAELVQLVLPARLASIRDVVANVIGAALGAGIAWVALSFHRRSVRSDPRADGGPGSSSVRAGSPSDRS